jgi:hypothetical protein
MGLVGESLTGGMGGDYTSWEASIKLHPANFGYTSS